MPKYLVTFAHTPEECARAGEEFIQHPRAKEILDATWWGCSSGDHTTWTVLDFAGEEAARSTLTEVFRDRARIVPVESFSYEDMTAAHS